MGWVLDGVGQLLARYLEKPAAGYEPFTPSDPDALRAALQPGDVLLVEGNNHISGVIKYLTQSTWSHAALYVGPIGDRATADGEPLVLVEANIGQGVVGAPLSKYARYPHPHLPADRPDRRRLRARLRLCGRAHRLRLRPQEHHRPDALSVPAAGAAALAPAHDGARLRPSDAHHLLGADRAGLRDACAIRSCRRSRGWRARRRAREILEIRHSSLYAPRDFDISPYFEVVKPTIEQRLRLQGAWPGPTCRDARRPTSWSTLAPRTPRPSSTR